MNLRKVRYSSHNVSIFFRSSIFLTNIGKIVYPSYEISRHTAIFQDREDVISYDLASQDLCRMDRAIEQKDFDEARTVYYKVRAEFEDALIKLHNGDHRLIYVRPNLV